LKIATIFSYGTNEESKDANGIYEEPELGMVAEPQAIWRFS
jgi:type I restriction enzyme R subunit